MAENYLKSLKDNCIFITNKNYIFENVKVLNELEGLTLLSNYLNSVNETFIDTETTGLDERTCTLLLTAIGDNNVQFVIDNTSINLSEILNKYQEKLFIGHNIKYDYKVLKSSLKISLFNLYDTMIVEQRIFQGFGYSDKNLNGIRFRLGSNDINNPDCLLFRYLKLPIHLQDKNIRKDFINLSKNSVFTEKQILYCAGDIKYLPYIKFKQISFIQSYNLSRIIKIENDLIPFLGNCELHGLKFNKNQWRENIKQNELNCFDTELLLDEEIKKLRLKSKYKDLIKGGKYDRIRRKQNEIVQIELFGEDLNIKEESKKNTFINYSSSKELIEIAAYLQIELPTKDDTYKIPTISPNGTINTWEFTTNRTSIELLVSEKTNAKGIDFIKKLVLYRKYITKINNFGENYIKKYVADNDYIYTIYRQCSALNGRFQSGGGKDDNRFNSQNVPAENTYKTCFSVEKEYSITTADLSGAEVTIMADKSNDTVLFDLAVIKDDVHSPIIQNGWRNIFLYRAGKKLNLWNAPKEYKAKKNDVNLIQQIEYHKSPLIIELYDKFLNFIVSKSINTNLRKTGKNLTFGAVYGCRSKKAGKTINVTIDEGEVYLDSIKEIIPNTFKYVENNVKYTLKYGYLILDEYTGTRINFPAVIRSIRTKTELDFQDFRNVDGEARNIPISGTQANMIKKAIVVIGQYILKNNLDCELLLQVHDELVYKQPRNFDGISKEFFNNPQFIILELSENIKILNVVEIENFKYQKINIEINLLHLYCWDIKKENNKWKIKIDFPNFVKLKMCQVSNEFLKHFYMKAEISIADTWIK